MEDDRVAIIGSGASSIQTVPNMQPHVKHMNIFVRTGVWFVQIANNLGQNKEHSQEERDEFRRDPRKLLAHAKDMENQAIGFGVLSILEVRRRRQFKHFLESG
jgi:cation diffusion facilitator CzcD-associated flavoprotein CzcO